MKNKNEIFIMSNCGGHANYEEQEDTNDLDEIVAMIGPHIINNDDKSNVVEEEEDEDIVVLSMMVPYLKPKKRG